jgi:hypothetical protein
MAQVATEGVVFPTASDGSRSTTRTGAEILAAALRPLDPDQADAALRENHWRRTYPTYFRTLVQGALPSAELVLASARAGLDAAWDSMRWEQDGQQMSLHNGLATHTPHFQTLSLRGKGDVAIAPWTVPLDGEQLSGDRLRMKIADWLARGIIEPSAASALERCLAHPEWFDLSDRTMVLLGAGSEAGPLRWLTRWRANVVAVDIDRPEVWQRIADIALAGNGTLQVPLRNGNGVVSTDDWMARAGANLITEAPGIAAWITGFSGPLDVASLAYLDGERHVRVAMGMDMVVQAACVANPQTTLAFLATPTDMFAVARETAQAAMDAYKERPLTSRTLQSSLHLATGDRFFQPNIEEFVRGPSGVQYGVADSMVIEQGPNYALAKRLQQWRALVARAAGHRVSLNVAPSTTTVSVTKNPLLAAGFAGASSFGLEVFEPETTNALMAALWVHDLRSDQSAANPARPLAHPLELFMDNACHGGLWRSAYLPRSALPMAAALGWVRKRFTA